ncbi:MAG: VCBS repeat-containing protein, partial [Planctomycetes bacterium]|nr:VCBS repeat-containing protein [Planctomycetota bacterium]
MRRALVLTLLLCACGEPSRPAPPPLELAPLRERVAEPGPRFRRLDPARTGLDFTNLLRRENVVAYVYTGAGVAVGDYDGDGRPDVYLVSQDGPNRLFRQVAPLRFEDVTVAAGGLDGGDAWGSAAAFVDVDDDGDLDLYVCNLESPNLLYENQGDGTFRERAGAYGLDAVAASMGVAFADYDNDGDLDAYLLTNRVLGSQLPTEIVAEVTLPKAIRKTKSELFPPYPTFPSAPGGGLQVPQGYADFYATIGDRVFVAGQADRLLRNDGGHFSEVTAAAGIRDQGNGLSVVWWDYDGDGHLDLYVANDLHSPDHLYRNLGDGRFEDVTKAALPHTTFFSMGCDFGDLDNDGRLDLCVADMSSTSHYMGKLLMGNMGTHRWFLENADPPQYMRNATFVNTGTGRFLEAAYLANLASTDWTWSLLLRDLDEDGRLDLFASNGIPVFTDDPDAGRRFDALWKEGRKQQALDVYRHLRRMEEKNIARRNLGDLKFADVGAEWGLDEQSVGQGAVLCDLDGDGDQDLIVNNLNQPVSVFENLSAGTHRVLVRLRGTTSNSAGIGSRITVTAGGVTQTRLLMPTRGYMSAGDPVEHFGLGEATKVDRLEVRWPTGAVQTFTELAADQLITIGEDGKAAPAAAPQVTGPGRFMPVDTIAVRHTERAFDDFAVQPLLPHRLSRLGPGIACGDVNGDGRDDVWVGGAAGQPGTLLLAQKDGTFVAQTGPWAGDSECEDMGAVFVDADRDGDLDLYVASGGVEAKQGDAALRDRLYLNDGSGVFTAAPTTATPDDRTSSSCVVAADFDRDGDLDLFVGGRVVPGRYPEGPPSRLLRNDAGTFVDVTAEFAPQLAAAGMVTSAVWSDLDGDGWPDLAVGAHWQPVRVFHNDGGKKLIDNTAALGLDVARGLWNGLAAADLDGDGDLDLIATNQGLNTKYKASAADPLRVYARDFDGNGSFDVVECKQQKGTALPVRGLSCSSEAMPFLAEKFPTYDAFAKATLGQIYGQEELAQSLEVSADELYHTVFENRGDKFVLHHLPRLAQISTGYGIGVADFDGDGDLDLVLAQNTWSPEPETGRTDGGVGLLLENRGGLQFEPVPPLSSGIVVPADMKGLAVLDLGRDTSPDFVMTVNDGATRAFRNTRSRSMAVR